MKTYRTFAWKELLSQKVMSILILLAIILSSMMTTAVGQSVGTLNAMRKQQAAYLNGNRYATVHQLTGEEADSIMSDNRLAYAEKMINIGVSDIDDGQLKIILREYHGNALSAYESISQLESGNLPTKAGEIALPQDALSLLGFEGDIGDRISLDLYVSLLHDTEAPYQYSYDFTLTGILKPNYISYVSGSVSGIAGAGTAENVLPEKYMLYSVDIRTKDKSAFQIIMNSLQERMSDQSDIQYNDILLSALGIHYDNSANAEKDSGFSAMNFTVIMIGVLVLLAAGLVIYNILKIAAAKRVKEYGILRAIGAGHGQIYSIVSLQLLILCGIGIPLGIILGILAANGITAGVTSLFSPEIFMTNSQNEVEALVSANGDSRVIPLIISTVVSLLFAFVAAMPAAHWAANVAPTISMSGRTINIKRKNRKTKRIHNFEAFYARMNMKRNRGRTIITVLSLVMSITVFVALQSFSALIDTSVDVLQMHPGDYSIISDTVGFSQDDLEEIQKLHGVTSISTVKYAVYGQDDSGYIEGLQTSFPLQPGECLQILGVDEAQLKKLYKIEDIESFIKGENCLILNPSWDDVESTIINSGETITVNNMPFLVYGNLNDPIHLGNRPFWNGVQVVVYDTVFDQITGQHNYTEICPILSDDADIDTIETAIQSLCDKTNGQWFSYRNVDRQLRESYEQIRLLAWGIILFVGLIGLLNIINTVYTNIHTRTAEIGIQRAIGMSAKSLYRTFLWEGVYYGIIATLIGGILGYGCSLFINVAADDIVQAMIMPLITVVEAAIASILACLLATSIPLRKISKMDIALAIGNEA